MPPMPKSVARFIRWGMCRCYVWPLDPRLPAGRCRRCGDRPFAIYEDEDTALDAFHREHDRLPAPLEGTWG